MWIGTRDGGLNLYDRNTRRFVRFRHSPTNPRSVAHNDIVCLYEDRAGTLWVGTEGGGLDRVDRPRIEFVHFRREPNDPSGISGNWVWSMYEDSRGNFWVGTWGAGLNRMDRVKNTFVRFQHNPKDPSSLSNNTVLCIVEDNEGNLWVGTQGGGLSLYDYATSRFTHFTEQDGLPNSVVYAILPDRSGNLWLSTNKGLSRFTPRTRTFKNYDISDGLQSHEFNQGAYCRGKDGTFYFGGMRGLNTFNPDSLEDNPFVPPMVLTRFKVFEKEVELSEAISVLKHITLSYSDNLFSFEFAALDFCAPEKNQYAYMLEGFDKGWIHSGTRRYVNYTQLDPGE
ncbi:MAG: two-component regulator propeller domain-containing protein, partial [Bacteroidota bacterium]